jgi:hypothetical protein
MPSLTIAMDTGARYHLLSVIRGVTTAGITLTPTTGTRPGATANVDRLVLQGHPDNGGGNVAYGDRGIATDGSSGSILLAGDKDVFQGPPCESLNKYVAVSASGTKLNVEWS